MSAKRLMDVREDGSRVIDINLVSNDGNWITEWYNFTRQWANEIELPMSVIEAGELSLDDAINDAADWAVRNWQEFDPDTGDEVEITNPTRVEMCKDLKNELERIYK